MFVKEIIKVSAEYLDIKNLIDFIDGKVESNDEIQSDINSLVLAVNMVNSFVASSYIELINVKDVMPDKDGKINYIDIDENGVIEIKNITSNSGEKIAFKCMPSGVVLDNDTLCKIEYSYFPSRVIFEDNIDYFSKLNKYIFAMGVVSEYLYLKGNIDDAYMWDKRFKNSIMNIVRPRRSITIPERRW